MDVKMVEVSPRPPSCSGGVFCSQNQKRKWSCSTCASGSRRTKLIRTTCDDKMSGGRGVFCYCSQPPVSSLVELRPSLVKTANHVYNFVGSHANVAFKSDTENNSANGNLQNLTVKFGLDWILFFVMADVKYTLAFKNQRLRFCTMFTIWTYVKRQNPQGHTDVYISLPTQMWLQESS